MTAGRGITRSARFMPARVLGDRPRGHPWIAFPGGGGGTDPSSAHRDGADLPQWHDIALIGRLIAGCTYRQTAGAQTRSPLCYAYPVLAVGTRAEAPADHAERAASSARGTIALVGYRDETGRTAEIGDVVSVARAVEHSTVMAVGGDPIGGRPFRWNVMSSSRERREQAAADWWAGRMRLPDTEDGNRPRCPMARSRRRTQCPDPTPTCLSQRHPSPSSRNSE